MLRGLIDLPRLSVLAVLALLLSAPSQALDIETVALDSPATGVPGLPGDARFSYFGYDPVIADTGQVAFQAKLVRGPGGVTDEDDTGIWATDPLGVLQLIARAGHQAPGTPEGALFEELFDGGYSDSSSPILSGSGHLAFMASLRVGTGGVTSANDLGIWAADPGGELELVVRKGDPPPGLGSSEFTGFFAGASLNDAGEIAFRAFLPSRSEGIWGPDGTGGLMPVALKEGPAPGVTGATFALFRQPALSNSGGVAFRANMAQLGGVVTAADDLAIWGPDATGDLTLRAREGRPAPGAPAGALFDHLEDPFVDASGEVAFVGRLRPGAGGVTDENDAGIWGPDGSGALTLLAREGDLAPGAVGALLFREFRDLRLNDAGDVALVAEMDLAPGGELAAGLFVSDGAGGIRLLAQEGQQAPDLPDGVVFDWLYDGNLALNDLGDVAFLARLAGPGVNSSNWLAVFFAPLDGDVSLLVRERDTVEVVPGVFKPVFVDVSDLSGRNGARGLSNARQLSSYGSISDWTSDRAVFRTTLPEPPEGECNDGADNDGDGLIDAEDPGCQHPLDPFETNCGSPVPFTSNEAEDAAPTVSESRIAWHQWDGADFEVLLSDGLSVNPVTDNLAHDTASSIAGATVAWEEWGAGRWRIMLWEGLAPVPLSDLSVDAWAPHSDGSGVVWSQGPSRFEAPEGVYHWDGSVTARVFGSSGGIEPAISGQRIVWESGAGIHIWTGSTSVLIPGSQGGHAPAISGQKVVWHASDGSDDEIHLWNESTTQQLTDNDIDDRNADVSGNRVVWESDAGIEVWQSGESSLIAGSLGGQFPKIDGIDVVWQASDGSDNEIYLATLCVACNDGVDNDGDAKIDYDGGLSALGYVAAETDPQCSDVPWKKSEAAFDPCGLGVELALLLPAFLWLHRRRGRAGGGMLLPLVALLAAGMPGASQASELPFSGMLDLHIATLRTVSIPGSSIASVSIAGPNHLASLTLPGGSFGPITTSLPLTNNGSTPSIRFTEIQNLAGSFPGISGGPPGGGTMGISGTAKICLVFAPCEYAHVPIPLAPTTGGAGFGIGGTVTVPGAVQMTLRHAPWTIGQPVMTIHTPNSNVETPVLPGGFAHGPASLTSSTAAGGGALQMVTATKAYTSLTGAFPEMPIFGVLHLAVALDPCSDGSDNDLDGFIDWPGDPGCDDAEDSSEQSPSLVCDNGLDDDGDGVIDVAGDPGCDHPTDPSEQSALIACDDGSDNDGDGLVDTADPGCADPGDGTETDPSLVCDDGLDDDGDGLVDTADPGCDDPLDPFEQNCGQLIPFTDNATEDAAPVVSGPNTAWHPGSKIAWHRWDAGDPEILLWDGSTVTPLTDNSVWDQSPAIAGDSVVWEQWGGGDSRIMRWTGASAVPLSDAGVSGWDADTDGSGVVWSQGPSLFDPPEGVYHWDGSETTQVFGSSGGLEPAISGEKIVWETAEGIHMWTGSNTVLIPGSAGGHAPAISGGKVVWHASDGSDDEVYLWNGSTAQPLTDNAGDDRNADISGNRVVWESAEGIQAWKGGESSLIAGSPGGQFPKIDGIDVVWQTPGGSDNEISLATLCVACNDGVDNEGDTKIDYDGGLSALGYMAAEADPQCGDDPWKNGEAPYRPCGLGIELGFLLAPLIWLHRRRGRRNPTG